MGRWLSAVSAALGAGLLAALLPSGTATAAPEAGDGVTERISVAADGTQGDEASFVPVISRNGRYVAFMSLATTLVPGPVPPGGWHATYLRDRQTGTLERLTSQGHQVDVHDFSATGERMLFRAHGGLHVRDLSTGHTQRVDLDLGEFAGGTPENTPRISGDGRYVVFTKRRPAGSTAAEGSRVYVRDLLNGTTRWVSHPNTEAETYYADDPVISDDGQRIAYTNVKYLPAEPTLAWRGHVHLLDRSTGERQMVDVSHEGPTPERAVRKPSLSADGGLVLFNRYDASAVTADDQYSDTFVRDLATGTTRPLPATAPQTGASAGSLSADGRFALYQASLPGPSPTVQTPHLRDLETGEVRTVATGTDGVPVSASASERVSISGDGRTVAFVSPAANLVPGDTNAAADVFVRTLPPAS
jgi:Tol biopolymer transport system component